MAESNYKREPLIDKFLPPQPPFVSREFGVQLARFTEAFNPMIENAINPDPVERDLPDLMGQFLSQVDLAPTPYEL